ncbi:MAG: tRNA(Met) cytidine acetate ligase [Thermocaproicibacter melissae]
MTIAGIIAEYNPLHNGHAFLLQEMRNLGADCVAVVMSGNFVQRGEAAILSKWARTREALSCGADLVVELPLPWAVSGAQHFSLGGVFLLSALGVDIIGFGSECGDIGKLSEAKQALVSPLLHEQMQKYLQQGMTFASARQNAVENLFGSETALLLRKPNNVLGIEYLSAIQQLGASLKPFTVKRVSLFDSSSDEPDAVASSSQIRKKIVDGSSVSQYMPVQAYQILKEEISSGRAPASLSFVERAMLSSFRQMDRVAFSSLPDISEGLENRIYASVQTAGSMSDLLKTAKTKRYPMARIRRILLSAFLGITKEDAKGLPPYLRILGIGKNGDKILRRAKEQKKLPIISRFSDTEQLNPRARRIMELENKSTDLYSLCMPQAGPCGLDRSTKIIVL